MSHSFCKKTINQTADVDINNGITLANGNSALAEDLMLMFARSIESDFKEIHQAFIKKDTEEMSNLVHKLNGALQYVGAPKLRLITQSMDIELKKRQKETEIPELFPLFEAAIKSFLAAQPNKQAR